MPSKSAHNEKIEFLYGTDIDYLMLNAVKKLGQVSSEELITIYYLLDVSFQKMGKPFTPSHSEEESLENQLRRGWLFQTSMRSPMFVYGPYAPKRVNSKVRAICGNGYKTLEKLLGEIAESGERKKLLECMERAVVAHEKLEEDMKIGYVEEFGLFKNAQEAREMFAKMGEYLKQTEQLNPEQSKK